MMEPERAAREDRLQGHVWWISSLLRDGMDPAGAP
jgi:hypothetical protein